jgi:membrane associated rhomboid family serine protease
MIFALFKAFFPSTYGQVIHYFMITPELSILLRQPWSIVTYMFLHEGFMHLLWNMLLFYTFGNILGDLLGDKKVLPTYILGGIAGIVFYILATFLVPYVSNSYAIGASAAVMAVVFSAVITAPDYMISLILIGPVRIKYLALFMLFFDIIGTRDESNSGGHFGHLGGVFMGCILVYSLRRGIDFSELVPKKALQRNPKTSQRPPHLKVVKDINKKSNSVSISMTDQERIDAILDKINKSGYSSLTDDEQQFLKKASKE